MCLLICGVFFHRTLWDVTKCYLSVLKMAMMEIFLSWVTCIHPYMPILRSDLHVREITYVRILNVVCGLFCGDL